MGLSKLLKKPLKKVSMKPKKKLYKAVKHPRKTDDEVITAGIYGKRGINTKRSVPVGKRTRKNIGVNRMAKKKLGGSRATKKVIPMPEKTVAIQKPRPAASRATPIPNIPKPTKKKVAPKRGAAPKRTTKGYTRRNQR